MTTTQMPQAILFDLDDTILDFTGPAGPAWQEVAARFDDDYGGVDAATVLATIDRISTAWWSDPERHRTGRLDLQATRIRNVADALTTLGISANGLARRMAATFAQLRTEGLRLFPGALETLQYFRARDTAMALLTNGDSLGQRAKIDRFDLARFFDCILIEQEFGVGKPDERIFGQALQDLGSAVDGTWMVGDNLKWEIEPCRRLGLYTIWVDPRQEGLPQGATITPHRTVHSIDELMES